MKLKFIGYAIPPLPVIAIVRSVYSDGGNTFFSISDKNYCIKDFFPLDPEALIGKIELPEEIRKGIGDPEFYVFFNVGARNLMGELIAIQNDLQALLDDVSLNVFAKMEIALFLKQRKTAEQLLSKYPDTEGSTDFRILKKQLNKVICKL